MPRVELCGEQAKGGDDGQVEAVAHGDESRVHAIIERRNARVIARIDLNDRRVFVDDLRFVVAHPLDLVRDLVEAALADRHAHGLLAAKDTT